MRTIIRLLSFFIIIILSASCASNKSLSDPNSSVYPLSERNSISSGTLIYGLPLTVVDIEIEAERVIEKPGPYARFAEDLLGLKDVIKAENEIWDLISIRINTHQELDPDEFYVIETNAVFKTNVLDLKREGLIMDINPERYNRFSENKLAGETEFGSFQVSDLGADEYFRDKSDTIYKIVSFDTSFVRIPYLIEKKQRLTLDQLAEKAAVRLMEIRDGKHLVLTGETNVFPQDQAAINELNRLEKEYTELFTGKTFKEIRSFVYHIIPKKDSINKKINLFAFSEVSGPDGSKKGNGTPVTITFIPEKKTKNLNISFSQSKKSSATPEYDKLFYRVPDVVNIWISKGDEILGSSRKLIYQFGEIIRMPSNYILDR